MAVERSLATFQWPWQYDFPPFYTLQTNLDTRSKQLDAWCDLVLAYYRHIRGFTMDITEAQSSQLFNNAKINRKLSIDMIQVILDELVKKGNVEWEDSNKTRCLVMWRSPQEWGKLIFQWACDQGLGSSVCTLYEVYLGEYASDQEFYNMEPWMVKKAIMALALEGKAEYIPGSNPDDSDAGVKFFA
jgi:ESCRT-II complex subunit VPS25